jgi:hypothetical protein
MTEIHLNTPCVSVNSKWTKDLNIQPEILTLVQKTAENTHEAIVIGRSFISRTQVAQQLRESVDKWDYMRIKTSAQKKKCSLNGRGHPQCGRKSLLFEH